jgi:hypothetical protein
LQNWLKGLIDRILARVLGWDDLEFAWAAGSAVDPLMQAQIDTAYVAAGIKTADEVRAALGLGALPSRAVAKFNPNHDARGRFASGDGAGSSRSLLQLASETGASDDDEAYRQRRLLHTETPQEDIKHGQSPLEIGASGLEIAPRGGAGGGLPGSMPGTAGPQAAPRLKLFEGNIGHIMTDRKGHLPDTPENRALIEDVANDPAAMLGPDEAGNLWAGRTLPDNTQVWAQLRGDRIINGGLKKQPHQYNPKTGLASPTKPMKKIDEITGLDE